MIWCPEGGLKFGIFRNKVHQLNYFRKVSNHTPGTLCAIQLEFLDRLAKFTSQNPDLNSKWVDYVYSNRVNALREAGLAPSIFLTVGK